MSGRLTAISVAWLAMTGVAAASEPEGDRPKTLGFVGQDSLALTLP